ncbi:MAG: hypothetical protein JWL59_3752 [Chthoniobacteraceae bacterium]|nr:hypothetical protein [Chthoniobacteraceae bacterium]
MNIIPKTPDTQTTRSGPIPAVEPRTHCPLCNALLDQANPSECPMCDWVAGYREQREKPTSSVRDRAAVVLSLIPGLGHIFKGYKVLGAVLMAGTAIAIIGAVVAATATALWGLLLLPLYWVAVMLHAFWLDDIAKPVEIHHGAAPTG